MLTVAPRGKTKRLMRRSMLFFSSRQRMVVGKVAELQGTIWTQSQSVRMSTTQLDIQWVLLSVYVHVHSAVSQSAVSESVYGQYQLVPLPVRQSAHQSTSEWVTRFGQSVKKSDSRCVSQTDRQTVSQSVSQSVPQSVIRSVSVSVNQSTNQAVKSVHYTNRLQASHTFIQWINQSSELISPTFLCHNHLNLHNPISYFKTHRV